MNVFIIYLIICNYSIIFSRINGKRIHVGNSVHNFRTTASYDNPEYNVKGISGTFPGNDADDLSENKHLFKLNVVVPKKPQVNFNDSNENTVYSASNLDKYKRLSTNVGEHSIKIQSILESGNLDSAPKGGGYDISVNPKYSHMISIMRRKDTNSERSPGPTETVREESPENHNLEFVPSSSTLHHEKFETTLATAQTESEFFNARDGEQSAFVEESEGSGEMFSKSEDDNDRMTPKSGRILGFLSGRQNETFPTCKTPKGEAGQCRRISDCLLSEAVNNFRVFLQHLCFIRGALVGICCPDNPVIEISNPEGNKTQNISEEIKQPPEGCGFNTKTRIVGGTIAGPQEWTWMVALLRRNRFYCGGVVINNWYVLTAAHCVLGINVKDLTVRLGEYDFNVHNKHKEDISVSEIKRHAQFVTLTFQHDIALLKLQRRITYSKFVGSICLPSQKARDYSDVKGTVVGWGTVSFGGSASPILRQVTVPVWKNEVCDKTYLLENIGDSFMCAGSPENGEDACQGDSGGPLMALNERGRWEVIGIVSWGRRCGDPTYPGVYTRVTTYLDWIMQNAT